MVKIVEKGKNVCTIDLNGDECTVSFAEDHQYFNISNFSDATVYASFESGVTADADGVVAIPSGAAKQLAVCENAPFEPLKATKSVCDVYIIGSGKIMVEAARKPFFNAAMRGGDTPTPQPEYKYAENPTVTADTYTGVVSSSGSNGYWPNAWMVFDGEIDTGSNRWVGNAGDGSWVQYSFSEAKQLGYILFNPTVESAGEAYKLTVYGTNDGGATLTQLYTTGDSGKVMGEGYTRIDINAAEKFKAFRFKVAKSGEIRMYTKEAIPEAVVTPDDLLTVSDAGNPVQLDGLQGGVPFNSVTVSGKNLLKYPYYNTKKTENGITFTDNGDGSITVDGTASADAKYYLSLPTVINKGKYTIGFENQDEYCHAHVYLFESPYTTFAISYINPNFVLAEDTKLTIRIVVKSGKSFSNFIIRPQLELGDTATAYEPPITGRELTVGVCGKNLLKYPYKDTTKTQNGVTFTDKGGGNITVNGTANENVYFSLSSNKALPKGKYIFGKSIDNILIYVDKYLDNAFYQRLVTSTETVKELIFNVSEEDAKKYTYRFGLQLNKNNIADNVTIYPQLELGDTATAYEPYHGAEYTITPDSNPYTIPDDIRQQDGLNNISVSEGELSVTGSLKNSTLKKVWDKLDELATVIIVSNGEI